MSLSAALDLHLTEAQARAQVNRYLTQRLGAAYSAGHSYLRDGRWCFMVSYQPADLSHALAVGVVTVDVATGRVNELTEDQLRNLRETGVVQAAQARGELARDEQGYVLRSHARIKASVWISDRVDLKVGANGGIFLPLDPPVWRFSIDFHLEDTHLDPLGVIDVDAKTGQVVPLTNEQIQAIRGCVRAVKQFQALAPAAGE
jgi:hypothetical protein